MPIQFGNANDNLLFGTPGYDTIYGGAGDDTIVAANDVDGEGADAYYGDAGFDTVDYSGLVDAIYMNFYIGYAIRNTGPGEYDFRDDFFSIEGVIGTDYNDTIIGAGDRRRP